MTSRGFTLVEMLVATLLVLAIAAALAAMAAPVRTAFDRTLAVGEINVRSRVALDRLSAELREAGSASGGITAVALADVYPTVVPMTSLDATATGPPWHAVRLLAVPLDGGQGVLKRDLPAGASVLELDTAMRCAQIRSVCGFQPGVRALLFDASHAESVTVRAIDATRSLIFLESSMSRGFAPGAALVVIDEVAYGLRDAGADTARLVRISAGGADQPVVDHVVDFEVTLSESDLLRVRRIDVLLRVEAVAAHFRGPASSLFRRPGTARREAEWVPDVEARMSVALRNR